MILWQWIMIILIVLLFLSLFIYVHGIQTELTDHRVNVHDRLDAIGTRLEKIPAPEERSPRKVPGEPPLAMVEEEEQAEAEFVAVITDLGSDDYPTDPGFLTVETAVVRPVPYKRGPADRPAPEQVGNPATEPQFQQRPAPQQVGRHRAPEPTG